MVSRYDLTFVALIAASHVPTYPRTHVRTYPQAPTPPGPELAQAPEAPKMTRDTSGPWDHGRRAQRTMPMNCNADPKFLRIIRCGSFLGDTLMSLGNSNRRLVLWTYFLCLVSLALFWAGLLTLIL